MPVNHAKEFLKSVHNEALFSHLFSRTLIEVRSVNFKAKFLKMAKINSEFLNVPMVEPAPESATTLVSLLVIADSSVVEAPYQSKAIVGEIAVLPCNTTAPRPQNPPILVIWYKNGGGDPVYR